MRKLLLISIVVSVLPSLYTSLSIECQTSDHLLMCKDSSRSIRVIHQLDTTETLRLCLKGSTSIPANVFNNISAENLVITNDRNVTNAHRKPNIIHYGPGSFNGLLSIKKIEINHVVLRGTTSPFAHLNSLASLTFDSNQLRGFPERICAGIPKLRILSFYNQQIQTLSLQSFGPYITDQLDHFTLIRSNLSSIEARTFSRWSSLSTLELSFNKLAILRPDVFVGLDNLRYLSIDNNQLRTIDPGAFGSLRKLRYLDLKMNHLAILPHELIKNNTYLAFLNLAGNVISNVSYEFFHESRNLRTLTLSFARNVSIGPNVFQGLHLRVLELDADSMNHLEAETFRGMSTDALILRRNGSIGFHPDLFKGFTVTRKVHIYEPEDSGFKPQKYGLECQVPVLRSDN